MAGGGTRGAYEAGVLHGLYNSAANKSEYAYDVVTGVSAGSLNLAGMATFEIGDEGTMVDTLSHYWQILTTKDIFKMWCPFPLITGLNKHGMVNTSPLRKFVERFFSDLGYEFKKRVAIAGVDVENGNYVIWNETASDVDKVNGIMTSSAIPFAFEAQHFVNEGKNFVGMDGGSVWNINLASAI